MSLLRQMRRSLMALFEAYVDRTRIMELEKY